MNKVKLIQSMSVAEIIEYEYDEIMKEREGVVKDYKNKIQSRVNAIRCKGEGVTVRPFEVRE